MRRPRRSSPRAAPARARALLVLAAVTAGVSCTAPPLPDPPASHPASPDAEEAPDVDGATPLVEPERAGGTR